MRNDDMDSERTPLDGLKRSGDGERRSRFFRFDPTVSSGTILQIAVLSVTAIVAYGKYQADTTQTHADIDQIRVTQARDREDVKSAVDALRVDLKDIKADVKDVNNVVVGLKAQADLGANKK